MNSASLSSRRYDLDWLRVGALALLVVTHVTYAYQPGWRVESSHTGFWATLLLKVLAPWRMSLIFFIAGVATRIMLEGRTLTAFTVNRFLRLGVPFLLAVFILIPVTIYITYPENHGRNFFEFAWNGPLRAWQVFGKYMPDLAHAWFLPYLITYAMLAAMVWYFLPGVWRAAQKAIDSLPLSVLLLGMAGLFAAADVFLEPIFGRTDALLNDPAGHIRCIPPFLVGVLLARSARFWERVQAARTFLLPSALLLLGALLAFTIRKHYVSGQPDWLVSGLVSLYGANALLSILSMCEWLPNSDSPQLRYFSDAIMPVYMLHECAILIIGTGLFTANLPVWAEYPMLLGMSLLVPLLIYQLIIRRVGPMRILFGLKLQLPAAPAAAGRTAGRQDVKAQVS